MRLADGIGDNGEILRLEICIGCNATRRTARHSNGQIVVIVTDPLPPFCTKRFDNFGSALSA